MDKWTNIEIARLLSRMAAAYTILGENRFKIIAYENAATSVEHATSELKDLFELGQLDSVPGLGASIREHLAELFTKGKSSHIERTLEKVNPAIFPLLEVPGIGPKKAQKLVEKLNIKSAHNAIDELEKCALNNKIAQLEDFGEKSQSDIIDNIARFKKGQIKEKRMVLPMADKIANELIEHLKKTCKEKIVKIDKLGSLRRQVSTIGDIDLSVASDDFESVIDAFVSCPFKVSLIERGPTGASILLASGRQADLRLSKPSDYGAMLQYFTGSKYHNIKLRDLALKKGYSLNEYGLSPVKVIKNERHVDKSAIKSFETEKELYEFLDLEYIPPEMREDSGEIEASANHALPKVVQLSDILGDLHTHSDYDLKPSHDYGADSMSDMLKIAKELGYEYFGFAEHNPKSSGLTSKEILSILQTRQQEIEKLKEKSPVKIITMLEIDIQPDGNLAIPHGGEEFLDAGIVSIHSSFAMDKTTMTNRVLKALGNPFAKILAHPTGRLLEERDGFELDWDRIFDYCSQFDKALEINAHPSRLDLSDTLVRQAVERKVKLVIDTDSHNKDDLINMTYGVSVARRGWATRDLIINTWPYQKLINWLQKR